MRQGKPSHRWWCLQSSVQPRQGNRAFTSDLVFEMELSFSRFLVIFIAL